MYAINVVKEDDIKYKYVLCIKFSVKIVTFLKRVVSLSIFLKVSETLILYVSLASVP